LGESKKDFEFRHSSKIKIDEWEKYFEYNLHDSVLTYKIFEKIWPDLWEFTKLMQEPVFSVSRNGMSANVEDYIIHNLNKFNEIPEKRPTYDEIGERKGRGKYEGAFVFQPMPGIYENIGIFDFTSSYGSVIVTYNLSKSTLLEEPEKNSNSIGIGNKKVYFSKKEGFFPEMLKEIIEKRRQYKEELKNKPDAIKKARSNAFKLLANASYGYLGFFGARYYSEDAAAATAAFAREAIKNIIEKIDKEGYKTIYSDTDSIAFLLGKRTKEDAKQFLKKLNSQLPGIMELELEDFYKRGIWVTKRTGEFGAKKKYALITEENKLKIRGFETVRRDWCNLARETQSKVLKLILEDGDEKKAVEFLKGIVKDVKERKIDLKKMTVRTQLKKPIDEYKAITPHVIAARKMLEREMPVDMGSMIEYYIAETPDKKKLVREKVKLADEKGEYEIEYYLKHQILPAVENILQVFNVDINMLLEKKKQKTLGEF
ncbi:MAG: DNA polymerase domain-containing protein, partial [Nanoarchaeota archaeon]